MVRHVSYATRALAFAAAFAIPTVVAAQDNRPVVVVFRFDNNSIGGNRAEFDGVQTGMQDLLITDLAGNNKVRVVDRAHLNDILTEQKLSKDGQVDQATALRIGRLLGAQYAITGGFMSDGKGKVRLTGRTIDMETSQIINPQTLDGNTNDVLTALSQLSTKVSANMNLAPKPGAGRRSGDASDASKSAPAQSGTPAATKSATSSVAVYANAPTKAITAVKLDGPTLKIYSSALDEMDKKNNAQAIKLLKQVTEKFPGFEPAERNLAKLGAKAGN